MKRKRFSEEKIIGVLKEQEAGAKVDDVCRRHAISSATFYAWRKKYGGLELSEAKRLRELEAENAKLKRIVADQLLDMSAMKDLLAKTGEARGEAQSRGLSDEREDAQRAAGLPDRRACPVGAAISAGGAGQRVGCGAHEGTCVGEPAIRLSPAPCGVAPRGAGGEPQTHLPAVYGRGLADAHEEAAEVAAPGSGIAPGA